MADRRLTTALRLVRAHGLAGLVWAAGMALMLVRANLKLLAARRAPALIFADRLTVLQGLRHAEIGPYARIARFARITAWRGGQLRIGRNFSLGESAIIENGFNIAAQKGRIDIGDNVGIGAFSFISCPSSVKIGSDCIVGQYFSVHAQNHNVGGAGLIRLQGTTEQGVEIGDNCWIGAKVTILDGVSIGAGCVIAAGAVVTKSFPANSVIGGCPARLLRPVK